MAEKCALIQAGYRLLLEQSFMPGLANAVDLPAGGLAVLYDKNKMEVYTSSLCRERMSYSARREERYVPLCRCQITRVSS